MSMVACEHWRPPLKHFFKGKKDIISSVERCLSDCCVSSLTAGMGEELFSPLKLFNSGFKVPSLGCRRS